MKTISLKVLVLLLFIINNSYTQHSNTNMSIINQKVKKLYDGLSLLNSFSEKANQAGNKLQFACKELRNQSPPTDSQTTDAWDYTLNKINYEENQLLKYLDSVEVQVEEIKQLAINCVNSWKALNKEIDDLNKSSDISLELLGNYREYYILLKEIFYKYDIFTEKYDKAIDDYNTSANDAIVYRNILKQKGKKTTGDEIKFTLSLPMFE